MTAARITPSRRVRVTPWFRQVEAAGVKAYTVYNSMLLPTEFAGVREDYDHLAQHVQVWDVACERQVQLHGPDAFALLQLMTPRDMTKLRDRQCFYVPLVDGEGRLINDPVVMRLDKHTYWLSIASSDVGLFAKGLAAGRGLKVEIDEPDMNPLAVQGPKAESLMARIFGDQVRAVKFFGFAWLPYQGVSLLVARSGFSGLGGFEIYVPGPRHAQGAYPSLATDLWDALFNAGQDLSVAAGCPNWIDFMEAGLLSYGNTIDANHTPYEVGLGKYCDGLETCLAHEALAKAVQEGPQRMIRALIFDTSDFSPQVYQDWAIEDEGGTWIGRLTGGSPSPHCGTHIGVGTLEKSHWHAGTRVVVQTPEGPRRARVAPMPLRK